LEYTINVEDDDEYTVEASMANGSSAPKINLIFDDQDTCSLSGKSIRNDWDTYTLAMGKIVLTEGTHTMRLVFNNDYTNIDFVEFKSTKVTNRIDASVPVFELVYDNNTIKVVSLNDVKQVRLIGMTGMPIAENDGDVLNVGNVRAGVYVVVAVTSNGEYYKKVSIAK